MRNFINFLLSITLVLFGSTPSFAVVKEADKQQLTKEVNLLPNGGFENGLAGWTATGTSTLTKDTSTPMFGKASATWNAAALGEKLQSGVFPVTQGMKGKTCLIEAQYKGDGLNADEIAMAVVNEGATVLATINITPTANDQTFSAQMNFSCPSTGSIGVEFESLVADPDGIELDSLFLGYGRNTQGIVSGNKTVTKILSGDVTSDTTISEFTFNDLVVGKWYHLTGKMAIIQDVTVADANILITVLNGGTAVERFQVDIRETTNTNPDSIKAGISAIFQATSPDLTFVTAGATVNNFLQGDGTRTETYIQLTTRNDIGNNAQETINLETSGGSFRAEHDDDCVWDATSTSYTNFGGDATCPFTSTVDGGIKSVNSVTFSGNNGPGVVINSSKAGRFMICANASIGSVVNDTVLNVRLYNQDQAQNISTHRIRNDAASGGRRNAITACGTTDLVAGIQTVLWQCAASGGDTCRMDHPGGGQAITWHGFFVEQQFPTPIFTDLNNRLDQIEDESVKTIGTSSEMYSIRIDGIASTISNEVGDWISTYTRSSTGVYDVTYNAGVFSGPINCTCSLANNSTRICRFNGLNDSGWTVEVVDTSGTFVNDRFAVICHGGRP